MNGRVYSPSLGQVLSPDPVTQAPENGQNYNRYAYAYNNPLKFVDSTGFVIEEVTVTASRVSGQGGGYSDHWFNTDDHALDQLFAATIAYNMGPGFHEKHPDFKRNMQAVMECLNGGSCEGVPEEIVDILVEHAGDAISSNGEPIEEPMVVGQAPSEGEAIPQEDYQGMCLTIVCGGSNIYKDPDCRTSMKAEKCYDPDLNPEWWERNLERTPEEEQGGFDSGPNLDEESDQRIRDIIKKKRDDILDGVKWELQL